MTITINVRHDWKKELAYLRSLQVRLQDAMRDANEESVEYLRSRTVEEVVSRTTMNATIASRITEYSSNTQGPSRTRGRVAFTPPPPGGWKIRPRNKKALAFTWRGENVVFRSVQHPGSRPYKLIRRVAERGIGVVEQIHTRKVGEVIR